MIVGDNQGELNPTVGGRWRAEFENLGFCLFSLGTIRSAFLTATPHSVPQVLPQLQVPIPNKIDFIRLASSEKLVVVGMNNGSIVVWDLQRLAGGDVSPFE